MSSVCYLSCHSGGRMIHNEATIKCSRFADDTCCARGRLLLLLQSDRCLLACWSNVDRSSSFAGSCSCIQRVCLRNRMMSRCRDLLFVAVAVTSLFAVTSCFTLLQELPNVCRSIIIPVIVVTMKIELTQFLAILNIAAAVSVLLNSCWLSIFSLVDIYKFWDLSLKLLNIS